MAKLPLKAISPLKAVHISPHDITKFDTTRIGSGLGRQNEGRGLYFTEPNAPGVPWYADLMTNMKVKAKSTGKTYDKNDEFLEVHDEIFKILEKVYPTTNKHELEHLSERAVSSLLSPRFTPPLVKGKDLEVKKILDEHFEPVDVKKPWKYDVNLNVGDPNDLPILNTHITQQPAKHKKALKDLVSQTYPISELAVTKTPTPGSQNFKAGTQIEMKWPERFAGRGWWTDQDPDAFIKQQLNELSYLQKNHPLKVIDKYFADKSPEKLREQGIPGFRYNTHEQVPPNEWGKRKDTVMVDDRLIDIINKSKIGLGGIGIGGAVLSQMGGGDAQAKPPDPLRSIEPDFKPVDLGRQGEITNLEPKNDSLYDWASYKLAENWFGDDREGVEKARRFLDTTGLGSISFAGDYVTKNIREHGLSRPEEIVGNLLAGIMPVPPGAKKAGKVVADDLGDAYKKLGKLLSDPKVPLHDQSISDLHEFIKDSLNEMNLANKFKTLKAQQETPLPDYSIVDTFKQKPWVEDSPAYNDLVNKKGEYANKPTIGPDPYTETGYPDDDLEIDLNDYSLDNDFSDLSHKSYPPGLSKDKLDPFLASNYDDYGEYIADQTKDLYVDSAGEVRNIAHPAISHNSASGIDASHISSHDFDEFDINKVGLGEGTIMEGHGIYGSNEPAVPPYYTRQFTTTNYDMFKDDPAKSRALDAIANNLWGTSTTKEALETTLGGMENFKLFRPGGWNPKVDDDTLKVLRDWSKNGIPEGAIESPFRYDYNMDADISMFPEYRQLLGEQNPDILKKMREVYESNPHTNLPLSGDWNYEQYYNELFRSNMREAGLTYPSHVGSVRFGKDQTIHPATKAQAVAIEAVKKHGGTPAAIADFVAKENQFQPYVFDDIMAALGDIEDGTLSIDSKVRGVAPKDVAAKTSSQLYKAGIPGHKYLPAEGAYGDQGTRNFVSYHHEYMNILKKIKMALAAGVPAAILAQQFGADDVQAAENYDTPQSPVEERHFQTWKQTNAPQDSGEDYDLRGAFRAGLHPVENGHWPDTFKKPNHPTFSDESIYATGANKTKAGHWENGKYIKHK